MSGDYKKKKGHITTNACLIKTFLAINVIIMLPIFILCNFQNLFLKAMNDFNIFLIYLII